MENIKIPKPLTEKELMECNYKQKQKELRIKRARAILLRKQTIEAYEILENIRFDYFGDTMFRNYYVSAKRELEGALSDFLLNDSYWDTKIKEHRNLTPEEYEEQQKDIVKDSQSSVR